MSGPNPTQINARLGRLGEALADTGTDLILVTNLIDVRYLTGYTGSSGVALIGPDTRVFVTDFRYVEQAAEEVDESYERLQADASSTLVDELLAVLPSGRVRLGFDDRHTTVAAYERLSEILPGHVVLAPTGGIVETLRRTKDAEEIQLIAAAQVLADAALEALLAGPVVGRTERELALALEHDMRRRGASGPAFASIVAAGPHGALPHASPRDVAIEPDTLLTVDWGATRDGYCSDCTRTFATGQIPDAMREAYALLLEAQTRAVAALAPGLDAHAADAVARDVLTDAGHGDHFGHGLGHGVGLEVHEAPRLSNRVPAGSEHLAVGDVVTVEPGIYLPGRFGLRIEDLCVIEDGPARVLTSIPKDLRILS